MVEVTKRESGDGYRFEAISADASRLYTYRADLVEVIDGDTFWVDID
jgi:endonuclease YncB( thermonuclease family)